MLSWECCYAEQTSTSYDRNKSTPSLAGAPHQLQGFPRRERHGAAAQPTVLSVLVLLRVLSVGWSPLPSSGSIAFSRAGQRARQPPHTPRHDVPSEEWKIKLAARAQTDGDKHRTTHDYQTPPRLPGRTRWQLHRAREAAPRQWPAAC